MNATDLVNEHGDYLYAFALSKVRNEELAKDLVQDAFLSALKALDEFQGKSSVRTWLTSILNRKIIDHWRKAENRLTTTIADTQFAALNAMESKDDTIEQVLEKVETSQKLNACIDKLPLKWQAVIQLRYLEEMKSDQVCKELAITPSNLWIIIHRAKLLLKDCLTN